MRMALSASVSMTITLLLIHGFDWILFIALIVALGCGLILEQIEKDKIEFLELQLEHLKAKLNEYKHEDDNLDTTTK